MRSSVAALTMWAACAGWVSQGCFAAWAALWQLGQCGQHEQARPVMVALQLEQLCGSLDNVGSISRLGRSWLLCSLVSYVAAWTLWAACAGYAGQDCLAAWQLCGSFGSSVAAYAAL